MLPMVCCLCPTYNHAQLLENAIKLFELQDYPADRRVMLILDDAGQFSPNEQSGPGWYLRSVRKRSQSLPHKYHALLDWSLDFQPDVYVLIDDDDVYLKSHISRSVAAVQESGWSHPSFIWSLYTGSPQLEGASGRFHGSLAVSRELLDRVGGWLGVMPTGHEKRADFDQRLLGSLRSVCQAGDPLRGGHPTYVYRWGSTGAFGHCSGLMASPDNEDWYDRYGQRSVQPFGHLRPALDAESQNLLSSLP